MILLLKNNRILITSLLISCALITFLLIKFPSKTKINDFESSLMSVEQYLKKLEIPEAEGGELFCDTPEGEKTQKYKSVKEYRKLKDQGYYGQKTYEMIKDVSYTSLGFEIDRVKEAKVVNKNFFKLNSRDWWEFLPAELIPMPGGCYNDDYWNIVKAEINSLVSGKLLGELKYTGIDAEIGEVTLLFNSQKDSYGETHNKLTFKAVLLADFNKDGIADLFIKGYHFKDSDSVFLGTCNSLGSSFTVILEKTNSLGRITILQ